MKRITILLSTLLLMVFGAKAQTDVTATYITNADFSSTSGWTQNHSNQYWTLGNGLIGTYAVANNKTSTTDANHLSSEYCLGIQCRWSTNYACFTQTTSLPVGGYTLTYDVQNTNTSTTSATYENRFTVTVGGTTYTDASTEWMRGSSGWTTHTISFSLTEAADATISLGYGTGSNNYGTNNTPHLYVSHLKMMYVSAEDLATNGMLTTFVVNGTFTDNVNGWTCTGGFQNQARASNQQGDFTVPFFENWNPSAKVNKMYQTISNVPNGTYKLKIAAFVNTFDGTTQYVFANDDKTYLTTGEPTFYEVWTVVTNNAIEIGLEQTTATANWMGIDNVSLTYYGAGDVRSQAQAGAHKADWDEAVANAQAALANSDYANVTGKEKTDLQAELAKAEPTTAQGYDDATVALRSATNAFIAAKTSYDIFAQYNVTLDYADAGKKPSVTTTSTAATIIPALRTYYESNALAEGVTGAVNMTSSITNATDPANNNGWTISGSMNNPASNESWTDADGTGNHSYFDGGNWGGNSWTTTMEQNVSIPAGRYLLTAKARAAENTTFTMEAAGESVDLPHVGNAGNVFDRGWGDASLYFETATNTTVTIKVTASSNTLHEWFSISNFRLIQLEAITVNLADATDYAALATAISEAEAKTLGFESGEYAPYNNVDALLALAAAKAINPENPNGNDKPSVQNATNTLTAAAWTANTSFVNPIYNGMFATVTSGANYPEGWTRSNAWGQMQSNLSGDFATAYYNQPGSLVYGSTGVYTMPLRANQAYKLTFSYRSHENNSNTGMTVRVNNDGNVLIAPTYAGNGSTSEWKTEYAYFTTGSAGNYVIELTNGGNTWMTNVSLEKIESTADDLNGDGKIDETDQQIAEQIAELRYTAGDFDGNNTIEATDVETLANILVGKTTEYNDKVADVNGNNHVTLADLTALVNVLNGDAEPRVVDETWKYATIDATVYAEQLATENTSANYTIDSAVCTLTREDVSDKFDMTDFLTTLKIAVSISGAQSVSIYAKGKENIAGLVTINVSGDASPTFAYSAGNSPSVYASSDQSNKNMFSDVVTVTGSNAGTYVAYLLPVTLSNGVTVTVRDSNGKFYSQDFTVTAGQENNLTFTETTATNNWMATIPGNINFSMLSTPGSHNSATSNCSSAAKCQSETIAQQLANGVRAFDIRPTYKYSSTITTENLYIFHGMVNTNVLYKDAIAAMVEFLQAHPTEAISVIMVKEDGTPLLGSWTDYTTEMCNAIDAIHTQYTDYIKLLDHSYYTLDDYRGKIFFGYRNAWDLHKTVRVTNWPDATSVTDYSVGVGGLCSASVEDAYNTSGDSKKTVVNALLNLASANENRARFHYTFTSVANSITSSANTQNPAAATYISGTLTGPTGYVYADFMGSSSYSGQTLLKAVIEQNYKYVYKGRTRVQ